MNLFNFEHFDDFNEFFFCTTKKQPPAHAKEDTREQNDHRLYHAMYNETTTACPSGRRHPRTKRPLPATRYVQRKKKNRLPIYIYTCN